MAVLNFRARTTRLLGIGWGLLVLLGATTGRAGFLDLHLYGGPLDPIPGTAIEDLTAHPSFPDDPALSSVREEMPLLENPWFPDPFEETAFIGEAGDQRGAGVMFEGYLEVPESGAWKFYIRSDNAGRLELNPEGPDADGAQVVAEEPDCCNEFVDDGIRSSEELQLERGDQHYFRVLMKTETGDDFVRIGWSGPDVPEPAPIDGRFVQRFVGESPGPDVFKAGAPEITRQPESRSVDEGEPVVFEVAVDALPPVDYQWLQDGDPIEGAVGSSLRLERASVEDDGAGFSVQISNESDTVVSETVELSVEPDRDPPQVIGASGSGEPHGIVVRFDEPVTEDSATDVSHYSISGQDVGLQNVILINESGVLLEVDEYGTDPMRINVENVRDRSQGANVIGPGAEVPVALATTLEAYWPFDEGEGNLARDIGGGHIGALEGDPEWTGDAAPLEGRSNSSALDFDGEGDFVATDYPGIGGSNPRTVSMWIRASDPEAESARMTAWGSRNDGAKYVFRIENDTQSLRTEVAGGFNFGSTGLEAEQWYHVVSVLPEGDSPNVENVLHYVNGELDPSAESASQEIDTDTESDEAHPVVIGQAELGREHFFEGALDDVAFYGDALSEQEIVALAEGANPQELAEPRSGEITIVEHPDDQVVQELDSVRFSVEATSAGDPGVIRYQWFRDNEPIEGAIEDTLVIESASLEDDGAVFGVEVFNADGAFQRLESDEAALTVEREAEPPQVVSVQGLAGAADEIRIVFDKVLDEASVTDLTNYSVEGLTIEDAQLAADGRTVILSTGDQPEGESFRLSIDGVADQTADGNVVTTEVSFTTSSLTAYWPFDEAEGEVAEDAIGGHEGLLQGGADWVEDAPELNRSNPSALAFDGIDGFVETDFPGIGGSDPRTISMWIRPEDPTSADARMLAWGSQNPGAKYVFRIENETATLRTEVDGGFNFGSTELQAGEWYHVASVVPDVESPNVQDVVHYVNGEPDPSGDSAAQGIDTDIASDEAHPVVIGQAELGREFFFEGAIDEVAVFHAALGDEEIRRLAEGNDPRALFGELAPELEIAAGEGEVTITWDGSGVLETASTLEGPWEETDRESPATFGIDQEARFFRVVE